MDHGDRSSPARLPAFPPSSPQAPRRVSRRGYTLAELMMVCAVLVILAAMVIPTAKHSVKRHKELELKYHLRTMRTAIDEYKKAFEMFKFAVEIDSEGYPPDLETLVEGVEVNNKKLKFLRRVPVDPMTGETEWGLRSLQDEPDTDSWGGQNVYDVYSLSEGVGLDGSKYSEW